MAEVFKEPASRYLLIAPSLLAFFLFLWPVGNSDLSRREAREGIPVVHMDRGASLWVPRINDQRVRTKPPLFYWAGLAVSKLMGGVSEISLRLPSVLAGTGTVFLTTALGFLLFSPAAGCMAGIVLATCWRYNYLASHARIDMLFAFFITLAFAGFWKMLHEQDEAKKNSTGVWVAGALGLAVLTKGPLGLIFPLLAWFLYRRMVGEGKVPWLHLSLIPLGLVGLWLVLAWMAGGDEFQSMIYRETIGRAAGDDSIQIHRKPFYYYVPQIFLGMAPWSLFLPVVLWQGFKTRREDARWLYPAVGLVTLFIFLSFFGGKRGDYLLPLYPMGALVIGHYFSESLSGSRLPWGQTVPAGMLAGLIGLVALVLFVPVLVNIDPDVHLSFLNDRDRYTISLLLLHDLPSRLILAVGSAVMLFFAVGLILALGKRSALQVWGLTAGWAILVLLFVQGPVAKRVNPYSSLKPFADQVRKIAPSSLAHYGEAGEDLLYYLDRPVEEVHGQKGLQTVLDRPGTALLVKGSQSGPLLEQYPRFRVILETKDLFRHYQLLGTAPVPAQS
ncbi:hypothetical protein UR09_03675 [Candidatus Nitromaritima sp. SCGC AAA799-A02]|nr:hypothetical protein UR09_03675 [Candidatus Nitromaritima sp. SCGC AAA799-A02]